MPFLVVILVFALLVPSIAPAQAGHSPYAHDRSDVVKTLGPAELADLLAGEGMGLALAAELNGYPGPRHVLELRDSLVLTPAQTDVVESIFAAMQQDAIAAGHRVIEAERALDAYFAQGAATTAGLAERVRALAAERAELRRVHLAAHVATRRVLTEHQVHSYQRLRGYAAGHEHGGSR